MSIKHAYVFVLYKAVNNKYMDSELVLLRVDNL